MQLQRWMFSNISRQALLLDGEVMAMPSHQRHANYLHQACLPAAVQHHIRYFVILQVTQVGGVAVPASEEVLLNRQNASRSG